ncbi:hypothetical protein EVAR_82525_1 [Eumeta japonica]|uniref:Uncharacterized protein n=1 Tax=Eumeta variegata TaxID=151549 RepID=A0A4C1UWB6_EUMVA|nr:hypothetical protein EVAR_82525_1 [Eumeta japonica]
MLTSLSLLFFTLRIALYSATISAWKTVQKGSSRSVKYQVSSSSRHSVRVDFALDSASVGVNVRPDYSKTVQSLGVQVLDALVLSFGHVREVRQIAEICRFHELPVEKDVSQVFTALHLI